jgi:hypothetical protein
MRATLRQAWPGEISNLAVAPAGGALFASHAVAAAGGPLFAGSQVRPWTCTTAADGLGAPVNAQCDGAAPLVTYKYKNAVTGTLLDYDAVAPPPATLVSQDHDGRGPHRTLRRPRRARHAGPIDLRHRHARRCLEPQALRPLRPGRRCARPGTVTPFRET